MNNLETMRVLRFGKSLLLCTLLLLLLNAVAGRAEEVKLVKQWTNLGDAPSTANGVNPASNKPALLVYAQGAEPGVKLRPFDSKSRAATDKAFWRFTSIGTNEKEEMVKFELVTRSEAGRHVKEIYFEVDEIKTERKYYLRPAGGAPLKSILLPGFTVKNENEFLEKPVSMVGVDMVNAYATRNKALEPSIAFKTGKGSTASLKLFYGFNHYENEKRVIFKSLLDVEATYRPKDTKSVLNKIEGEVDGLYQFNTHHTEVIPVPGHPGEFTIGPEPFLHAVVQAGFNARVESDQSFDSVQSTVGVTGYAAFNGSSVQWFAQRFSFNAPKDYSAPSPLLNISYELVTSLKDDALTQQHRTETTTDRLRVHLWMSHRLVHDWDLSRTWPFDDHYNIDLVVDSGYAYDFRNSTALPDVNLSMEFGPADPESKHMSFVVTYVNGKTNAKFENYNSILAGLKKAF